MTDDQKKFDKEFFDNVVSIKEYRNLEKKFPEIHNAAVFDNAMIAIGEQQRFLEARQNTSGELVISIRNDDATAKDGRSRYMLKDLVAQSFDVKNPKGYQYIGYKDNNPLNCKPENLQYVKDDPYPNNNPIKNNTSTYVIVNDKNKILETATTIDAIQALAEYKDKTKFRGGICGFKQPLPNDSKYPGCFVGKRDGESAIEFGF